MFKFQGGVDPLYTQAHTHRQYEAFITLELLTGLTSRLWSGMKPLLL